MFKSILIAIVALLILSSTALAATTCSPFTVAGSYVRQAGQYIDQLSLGVDGTAYWFNSGSFDQILLGAVLPEVGSWTCLDNGTVLVTMVGSNYSQHSDSGDVPQLDQPLDINISKNTRVTLKLSLVDRDTFLQTHRIVTATPLGSDPLGPGTLGVSSCMPSGTPCGPAPYKRIKPQVTDIP